MCGLRPFGPCYDTTVQRKEKAVCPLPPSPSGEQKQKSSEYLSRQAARRAIWQALVRNGGGNCLRRMLRDFPLPLATAFALLSPERWSKHPREPVVVVCRSIGLLGCLEAFHSVSQLVSPSNLGSAYYFCSAAAALVDPSKAIVVNKQLQRRNPLCDEKSSLCCGFLPHTTTCYFCCCCRCCCRQQHLHHRLPGDKMNFNFKCSCKHHHYHWLNMDIVNYRK